MMRNLVYDLLSDIIFRFRVSFGYDALMYTNNRSGPWPPQIILNINEVVMRKMRNITFHWRPEMQEDGRMVGVARIPRWRTMANFTYH